MASPYPSRFNSDVEIPRIDNNVTEIGGNAINGLRDAVFAIEKILGINVHGSATDLVTRLNQALDANGNLKASAISTLWSGSPITNSHVGNNAGIEEVKLDLDYGTTQLKTWIDTLRVRVNTMFQRLAIDITNLAQHTSHPSSFGRHRTSDIDGYATPYDGYNVQGILTDIFSRLSTHINHGINPTTEIGAHMAESISADDSSFFSARGNDVQEVLESLDHLEMRELTRHRDRQHSNGILNTQETFYNATQFGVTVVASAAIETQTVGTKFIRYTASPTGFGNIQKDDTIVITNGALSTSPTYAFKVDRIDTVGLFDFVYIQGSLPADLVAGSTAIVYRNTEETSSPSVLINAIKDRTLGAPRIVTVVHPGAPYVVGSGLNPGLIVNGSIENIRIDWSTGTYTFDLEARLTAISTALDWTPQVIVNTINTEFVDNNLPLTAFLFENEIGIALDEPLQDGYIGIIAPASNSAWGALGFSEGITWYTHTERKSYVDGYEATDMSLLINETATLAAGGATITFATTLPESLGVTIGSLVRVVNGTDDGTYLVSGIINNVITVINTVGFVGNSATIRIYADTFYELPPTNRTFYETYVDVSKTDDSLYFRGSLRAQYTDDGGAVGQTLEDKISIVAVSRNFTRSTMRIVFDNANDTLQLGEPDGVGTGLLAGTRGPTVTVPATPIGRVFRLYDYSRTAYIEVQVINAFGVGLFGILNCDIEDRISEEFHLQTGTVLHNLTRFVNLTDSRLFGTIGRADIRTDFKRDYTSYPLSRIRGNGIIYGFSVEALGTTIVDAYGGEVLVDGAIKNVGTKSIVIPPDAGPGNITYNLFVDNDGEFNFLPNDRNFNLTPSLEEIIMSEDKVIIAQVVTNSGLFVSSTDYRRFVNNLDNKIELIVEDNDITHGSFATIGAAANWINAIATNYPTSKTIRIRGSITYDVSILGSTTLPDGVTLIGDANVDGYNSAYGSRINVINNTTGLSVLIPQDSCIIKNIAFEAAASSTDMSNGFIGGSTIDVSNLRIEGCSFAYPSQSVDFYGIVVNQFYGMSISDCTFLNNGTAITNTSGAVAEIRNCYFDNCFNYGIFLNYVINVNIHHNQMRFTTLAPAGQGIRVNSAFRVNICDNILSSLDSSGSLAGRIMIVIDFASIFTQINNNTLINTSTTNQGFGLGILYGNSGSSSPDHYYADISGNKLQYFSGGIVQQAITILKSTRATIRGNHVLNSRSAIDIADAADECTRISIIDNILESSDTDISILRARNASTAHLRIMGNHFYSSEAVAAGHLVSITGAWSSIISSNIFEATSTPFSALYVNMDYSVVSNNIIYASHFTNSANAPIQVDSNFATTNNNVSSIGTIATPASIGTGTRSGGIVDGYAGSYNVDLNNKEQTYYAIIPASRGVFDTTGNWSFTYGGAGIGSKTYLGNTVGGAADYVNIEFSNTDIPTGAHITKIEIRTSYGVVGDLSAQLYKTDWDVAGTAAGTQIAGAIAPVANLITIDLSGTVQVMQTDSVYTIPIVCGALFTGPVTIDGIRITYIL